MKIKFTSNIKQLDNDNQISFDSPVTVSKWNTFDVYEFLEPQNKIMNRIEISATEVNIFAGPTSIILQLDKEIETVYQTANGRIVFKALMSKLTQSPNKITFFYTLKTVNGDLVGQYDISLELS